MGGCNLASSVRSLAVALGTSWPPQETNHPSLATGQPLLGAGRPSVGASRRRPPAVVWVEIAQSQRQRRGRFTNRRIGDLEVQGIRDGGDLGLKKGSILTSTVVSICPGHHLAGASLEVGGGARVSRRHLRPRNRESQLPSEGGEEKSREKTRSVEPVRRIV